MDKIPLVALCGFLGSGKTTLLRRWRRDESLKHAALIVHDLSELGLDVELLSGEGETPEAGSLKDRVAALHGSHAREKLQASVGAALDEIAELQPAAPLVLCESTGAARPWPLIRALAQDKRFFLRHFIVTVDALNLHRDFADGRLLTGEAGKSEDDAIRCAAEVLAEQIAFASIVILTKVDTLPDAVVEAQVKTLQKLQPEAAIGLSAQAGLLLKQLESTPAPSLSSLKSKAEKFGLVELSATAEEVEAVVFRDPRPFHPQRLYEACQNKMGTGLYRTKGFMWLASRPADVLLWQQAGSQISLEFIGLWRAEVAKDAESKLLPEEIEHLKFELEKEDPVFGDRHNELTLIGLEVDREAFYFAMEEALCTEAEVAAWQDGKSFEDPWPKSNRRMK